jgi:hypothetical protein
MGVGAASVRGLVSPQAAFVLLILTGKLHKNNYMHATAGAPGGGKGSGTQVALS